MDSQLANLLITGTITLFLAFFVTLWLWDTNKSRPGTFKLPLKQYKAIMRFVQFGKVPTLCGNHAKTLIQRKGKMALVDNTNCEICTKKSRLI